MCPRPTPTSGIYDSSRSPQRGFALVSAIFLLVVLAVLGAFMVTLSTVQNVTSTQDLQGSRAYQATRAGIEWGAYQVRTSEHTGQAPYICPATTTLNHLTGSLAGFSVQVLCVKTTYDEGGNKIAVYQLTSTATLGTVASTNYVERQLSAAISTCRIGQINGVPCTD